MSPDGQHDVNEEESFESERDSPRQETIDLDYIVASSPSNLDAATALILHACSDAVNDSSFYKNSS